MCYSGRISKLLESLLDIASNIDIFFVRPAKMLLMSRGRVKPAFTSQFFYLLFLHRL